jgi:hypothetical protein
VRHQRVANDTLTFRVAAAIAGLVALIVVAWVLLSADDRLDDGQADRAALHAAVKQADAEAADQRAKTALLANQLRDLGEDPVVEPSNPDPLPTNNVPSPALLMLYAARAVESYCAGDRCDGEPGLDGKPGDDGADAPPVTAEEIAAAVAAYCAAHDDCRGPKGDQGDPAPTPDPTDEPTDSPLP